MLYIDGQDTKTVKLHICEQTAWHLIFRYKHDKIIFFTVGWRIARRWIHRFPPLQATRLDNILLNTIYSSQYLYVPLSSHLREMYELTAL
jgi:hypothetical protein